MFSIENVVTLFSISGMVTFSTRDPKYSHVFKGYARFHQQLGYAYYLQVLCTLWLCTSKSKKSCEEIEEGNHWKYIDQGEDKILSFKSKEYQPFKCMTFVGKS